MNPPEFKALYDELVYVFKALNEYYNVQHEPQIGVIVDDPIDILGDYFFDNQFALNTRINLHNQLVEEIKTTTNYIAEFLEIVEPFKVIQLANAYEFFACFVQAARDNEDEHIQAYLNISGYFDTHKDVMDIIRADGDFLLHNMPVGV